MTPPSPTSRTELRAALSVHPVDDARPSEASREPTPPLRRAWRLLAPALALALWWPAGFFGLDDWFFLPLRARDGDLVFLGAAAAATAAAALVRSVWLRILVVALLSGLGWLLGAPEIESVAGERMVLAGLLASGGLLGLVLGARGSRGPLPLAVALALVAGLTPAAWPDGPVIALALVLPFVGVPLRRLGGTAGGALGVLVAWLVAELPSRGLRAGWDALQGGLPRDQVADGLATVGRAGVDHLGAEGLEAVLNLLRENTVWFLVAAVAALALVAVAGVQAARVARARRARRAQDARETETTPAPS